MFGKWRCGKVRKWVWRDFIQVTTNASQYLIFVCPWKQCISLIFVTLKILPKAANRKFVCNGKQLQTDHRIIVHLFFKTCMFRRIHSSLFYHPFLLTIFCIKRRYFYLRYVTLASKTWGPMKKAYFLIQTSTLTLSVYLHENIMTCLTTIMLKISQIPIN